MSRGFSEWFEGPRRLVLAGVALLLVGLIVYLLIGGNDTDTTPPELRPVRAAFAKQDVPKLLDFAKDSNPKVVGEAFWCLQQLKYPQLGPLLREKVDPSQPAAIRASALSNLGSLKDPADVPALAAATTDADPAIRRAACEGLAPIPSAGVIEPLAAVLEKPSEELAVWQAAWVALKQATGASVMVKTTLSPAERKAAADDFRSRIPEFTALYKAMANQSNGHPVAKPKE